MYTNTTIHVLLTPADAGDYSWQCGPGAAFCFQYVYSGNMLSYLSGPLGYLALKPFLCFCVLYFIVLLY